MRLLSAKAYSRLLTGAYALGLLLTFFFGGNAYFNNRIDESLLYVIPLGLTGLLLYGQSLLAKHEVIGIKRSHVWVALLLIYCVITWYADQMHNLQFTY